MTRVRFVGRYLFKFKVEGCVSEQGGKVGRFVLESAADLDAGTSLVLVPTTKCTFSQSCTSFWRPKRASNRLTDLNVEKPEASTAKLVSKAFRGKLLSVISSRRIGGKSGISRYLIIEL